MLNTTAQSSDTLLCIDKVDEGIANIALVLEVHSQVQEVELAKVRLVNTLQQHLLLENQAI